MKRYQSALKSEDVHDMKGFLDLAGFLLSALESIHEQGIVHRDIKPDNILIEETNFVLADFGMGFKAAGFNTHGAKAEDNFHRMAYPRWRQDHGGIDKGCNYQ